MRGKKYTKDMLKIVASCHTTRISFKKNNSGAYRAATEMGVLDEICSHMVSGRGFWTKELAHKKAIKYTNRWEFQKNDKSAYLFAHKAGILDEICSHMVVLSREPYTEEEMAIVAKNYPTRLALKRGNQVVYRKATKLGILDKICAHMEYTCRPPYADEELVKIGSEYLSRVSFRDGNNPAYNACVRRGILDKVCAHMKPSRDSSRPELLLLEIIKEKFPEAKKLSNSKVELKNKPWIHRFDADIYVPSLNKGVEFDGTYHHSFKGLKRGHPGWPNEDILNYHQIKDEHFKSKGISLLHIKGEDWLKNKDTCIEKCFNFLNNKE